MQFDVVTLFPEMFLALTQWGVTGRAFQRQQCVLRTWNLREFADPPHFQVDDRPYGGGPGMVMKPEPLERAIKAAKNAQTGPSGGGSRVLLMSPRGKVLTQAGLHELCSASGVIIVCGRYQDVDWRLLDRFDAEISVGDFVVSGGELPAMLLLDGLIRLLPGVLGNADSLHEESFSEGLLDHPHYTRPVEYQEQRVPDVLLSGDHAKVKEWRRQQALLVTQERRPDLLRATLNAKAPEGSADCE